MTQQGVDVLADVVVAGAFAKAFGTGLVMGQSAAGDLLQLLVIEGHGGPPCKTWRPFNPILQPLRGRVTIAA
jgi:hypothetical protein